jgi:hypothetical protein
MKKPDLYSTVDTYEGFDKFAVVKELPPSVVFRMKQLLLDCCVNYKGEWSGNNPFHDLEMLCAITDDNVEHAEKFLDEPEKTHAIWQNGLMKKGFEEIRDQLLERFREDGRE